MMISNTRQNGNALIIVLVTVALFAALIFTFTRSANRGANNLSRNQVTIAAQDILNYAQAVENAVNRVRVKSCSENQISFDYDVDGITGYENNDAPDDYRCHVFHEDGGQAVWQSPPSYANDGSAYFYRPARVLRVGKDKTACDPSAGPCADLVMMLGQVDERICQELNKSINTTPTIPTQNDGQNYEATKFTGTMNIMGQGDIDGDASGKTSLCIESADNKYYFYHVLFAR